MARIKKVNQEMEVKEEVAMEQKVEQSTEQKVEEEVKMEQRMEQEVVQGEAHLAGLELKNRIDAVVKGEGSKSGKMKELFGMGLAIKEIAVLLDVRYNFVYNVISNHCIVSGVELVHTKKESKKDIVWEMFDKGMTVKEVAVDLKSNYQYIYKLHKEWKDQAAKEVAAQDEVVGGDK